MEKHQVVLIIISVATIHPPLCQAHGPKLMCNLAVEVVNYRLVLLHPGPSAAACNLTSLEYSIGSLLYNEVLGLGVVSAVVGNNEGWMLTLFDEAQDEVVGPMLLLWIVQEEICWFELQDESGFNQISIVLDIGDFVQLDARSILQNFSNNQIIPQLIPRHFGDIIVLFDEASLFDFTSTTGSDRYTHILSVNIWQRSLRRPVQSQVRFRLQVCASTCHSCSLNLAVVSDCPPGKGLVFLYPNNSNEDYLLPFNYRPPSHLGVGVALSPHVYNADPSKPFPVCHVELSINPVYKQCAGKARRSDCNCVPEQETLSEINWSDCIQRIYQHLYAHALPLRFTLWDIENVTEADTSSWNLTIEELNNRTDYIVNNKPQRRVNFLGAGLYHFRANVSNIPTFCSVTTQFTVFVIRPPLRVTEEHIITTLTVVSCGLTLLLAYTIHHYLPAGLFRRIPTLKIPSRSHKNTDKPSNSDEVQGQGSEGLLGQKLSMDRIRDRSMSADRLQDLRQRSSDTVKALSPSKQ